MILMIVRKSKTNWGENMTNTIIRLWHGELEPSSYTGMNDPELRQLERLLQRNGERLEEYLDEKRKALFEKYFNCIEEYITVLCEQSFCNGFCLGTRLAAEALLTQE